MTQGTPGMGPRLCDRRVVVTGAASGIGRATAEIFAGHGASLILIDRKLPPTPEADGAATAWATAVDITDDKALRDAIAEGATALGGIDGVVNAAGVHAKGSVHDVDTASFRQVLEVNLTGSYSVVRHALPWLRRSPNATVVNIGSGQSLLPDSPDRVAYAASKGGVITLTKAMAAEFAPDIRVNCVCPGLVATPMMAGIEGRVKRHALGRAADPREISMAILFLTAQESSYVTGSVLSVDGGRTYH